MEKNRTFHQLGRDLDWGEATFSFEWELAYFIPATDKFLSFLQSLKTTSKRHIFIKFAFEIQVTLD